MISSGAQDVMELTGAQGARLLPWVGVVVKRVDLEAGRIEVDWGADW
jgi:ribosomal 30S subunit maturation factor RimM